MLDNESIIVLHPESGRGYKIVINGIGKNFELHTLLLDAVVGDPVEECVPDEQSDLRVMEAFSGGAFPMPGEEGYMGFLSASSFYRRVYE